MTPGPPTGDPALGAVLAARAPRGVGNLTAFVVDGDRTRHAGLGMDEHTEHEIGSITKTMVGELLRQAIAAGTVSADTTVVDLVGTEARDAPAADVTLRELVGHTSGLPATGPLGVRGWLRAVGGSDPYDRITADALVADALAAPLSGRGEWAYSNLGMALLGHLLARVGGVGFPQLIRDGVFTPLGMKATFVPQGPLPRTALRGRTPFGTLAEPWTSVGYAPAGTTRSTASDMARYARHVLAGEGELFGWVQGTVEGAAMWWHNGGTGGYRSILVLDRGTGTAAYVATDSSVEVDDLGLDLFRHAREGRA